MKAREFWLLFAPSLIVMGGLLVLPLFRTVQWSLEDVHYGVPGTFVGLDNFADALTDPSMGCAGRGTPARSSRCLISRLEKITSKPAPTEKYRLAAYERVGWR